MEGRPDASDVEQSRERTLLHGIIEHFFIAYCVIADAPSRASSWTYSHGYYAPDLSSCSPFIIRTSRPHKPARTRLRSRPLVFGPSDFVHALGPKCREEAREIVKHRCPLSICPLSTFIPSRLPPVPSTPAFAGPQIVS